MFFVIQLRRLLTVKIKLISATSTLALILIVNSIGTATAADRDFKTALEECFWGLILTDESQRGLSLGLNVVSGALGTYAYTSATMSPDTFCAEKTASTAKFINETYPRLAEDVSRGQGEFLRTAMQLAGCNSIASQQAVYTDIRNGLTEDLSHVNYSSMQDAEKALRLYYNLNVSAQSNCTA
ncbi:MAG: DUF3015 family protein [Granulosicoccus sp.]